MNADLNISQTHPNHSVDWRYLLPISMNGKVLYVGEGTNDVTRSFEQIGIPLSIWESTVSLTDIFTLGFVPATFDAVVIPFGLLPESPLGRSGKVNVYQAAHQLIREGGTLLIGFSNKWFARGKHISSAAPNRDGPRARRSRSSRRLRP